VADILEFRARPREFYTVVPGEHTAPGEGEPVPVTYAHTPAGCLSALVHALFLSRGGGEQHVTLTEGRITRTIQVCQDGQRVTEDILLPDPYRTCWWPQPQDIREGSPGGHIPEVCTHEKQLEHERRTGRKPRRSRHYEAPQWPGIESVT
jgi:hypothetical protein